MRICVSLFCALALWCQSARAQEVESDCTGVEFAADQMGVRARDDEGNWRYITAGDVESVSVARLARGAVQVQNGRIVRDAEGRPVRAPGFIAVRRLSVERLTQLLGPCAETYATVLGPMMDLPRLVVEPPSAQPRLEAGQMVSGALGGSPFRYFATAGADLLVYPDSLYAVQDHEACGLAPPSEQADLCTPEQRQQLTGVVRLIADRLTELGVTEVDRRSTYRFEDGKLIVDLRVRTPSGRQELHFAED
jgi:hypothetical protein